MLITNYLDTTSLATGCNFLAKLMCVGEGGGGYTACNAYSLFLVVLNWMSSCMHDFNHTEVAVSVFC